MNFKNLFCIGLTLVSGLSVNAQDASNAQIEHSQVIDSNAAFYRAVHALMCMRLSRDNALTAIRYMPRNVSVELWKDIINNNRINLQPVGDHLVSLSYCGFAKAKIEDPERFDHGVRYHAVKDFLEIELYRLIYKMTFEKVMHYDSNSEEILLFKNILTPREFAEARPWIKAESDTVDLSMLPRSILEKIRETVNQASFDEAFICLMMDGFRMQDEYAPGFDDGDWSSKEYRLLINQKIRTIIEQQELPERRAFVRFLYTDQEVANEYMNSKQLSEAL